MRASRVSVVLACGLLAVGCVDDDGARPGAPALDGSSQGNLALTMDIPGDTDVAGFSFAVTQVSCTGGELLERPALQVPFAPLEDMRISEVDEGLVSFEERAGHLFVEHFMVLEAGCYDVTAQPMTGAARPSTQCAPAHALSVHVNDVWPTEVALFSQCEGGDAGGLDGMAALNHAPHITALTYNPSQFAFVCEQVTACVTAEDPDGDPLDFGWLQRAGPGLFADPVVVARQREANGGWTECARYAPGAPGELELQVRVHDTMLDENGSAIAVQDFLRRSEPGAVSSDDIVFPVHVRADDHLFCRDPQSHPRPGPGS